MTSGVGRGRLVRPSMTDGGAAIKARGCPPICFANRFPPRPLRSAGRCPAALTATPPPVSVMSFSIPGTKRWKDIDMSGQQQIRTSDSVMAALVAGLELEFGAGAGRHLAARFLEAEASDFRWAARERERWLGSYESLDEEDVELDRMAILGRSEDRWFVAICIVDGDGEAHGLIGERMFETRIEAERALVAAH
jgi:hypothetical protein